MNNFKDLFFALLIYSPTLVLAPQPIIYLVIAFIGIISWLFRNKNNNLSKDDIFYFFFIVFSIIIYIVGKPFIIQDSNKSINDFIPYSIFIVATINFSSTLKINTIKYLYYLIIFETCIAIVQYIIGVPYFIKPLALGAQAFGDSEYLYYNKVYGLSSVTSIFAMKIFAGILLTYYLKIKKSYILYFVLILGLLATFNRTSIVVSLIFGITVLLKDLKNTSLKKKVIIIFSSLTVFSVVVFNLANIENQFFRGKGIDLSGRDLVFPYYTNFIENHLFFGNYFTKHWAELLPGRIFHAHNSYLQTIANMGIMMGGFLFSFIFKKINRSNYFYIVPILIYSGFQYGILWGVSFLDIIFFYFLMQKIPFNRSETN